MKLHVTVLERTERFYVVSDETSTFLARFGKLLDAGRAAGHAIGLHRQVNTAGPTLRLGAPK